MLTIGSMRERGLEGAIGEVLVEGPLTSFDGSDRAIKYVCCLWVDPNGECTEVGGGEERVLIYDYSVL
jgi:hypothetical protein